MRTNPSQSDGGASGAQPSDPLRAAAPNQPDGRPCGLLRLLMVMVYDAIVILAILMIAGAVALELPFRHQSAGKDPAYTLYLLMFWFFYLAWCWRHGGMTLGMRAWRVRLVNLRQHGANPVPAWWQCGLRFAGAWLSAATAGLGYLWILLDREKRSWHDRLSRTCLLHVGKTGRRTRSDSSPKEIDGGQAKQ